MASMIVVEQELVRWQKMQQQQGHPVTKPAWDMEGVKTGAATVLGQGIVVANSTDDQPKEKMVQSISTIQHATHGPIAHASKNSKNPCGCVPPPTPLLVLPSSLSVTTSHSSCCASNSPPSSHPSSPDCTTLILPHPTSFDALPPAPSLPSLRLSVPRFDDTTEPCRLNPTGHRPVLKRSTSSPSLLGAPPLASPAGSVLSFQSIAGETYRPGILLTSSSSLFSRLPPSSQSAPWPFARSRSFDPGSVEPPPLFPGSSIALLTSVSTIQQQPQPLRRQHRQQLQGFSSSPHNNQHQQDNLQQPMETNQPSSTDRCTRRRNGHRKALRSPTAGSNAHRLRSRSTSSLVHLAQSFMEDSLLFRSSAAVSSSDHHSHPSSSKARASYGKTRRPLSFFSSVASITPITTTTASPPHCASILSSNSDQGEATRVRGQSRRQRLAQPRKSLADLLFEAQSHYISHRYPQALALYLEAVCDHESVQACNSLYALYTAAKQERGLVRSDTRATRALIHALQIWARKRWPQANVSSDPVISSLMNLDPLLKTIYATSDQQSSVHPHQLQGSQPTSPTSASSAEGKPKRRDLIESFFADGSSRFWRKGRIEVRDHGSGESLHHHPRQGALTDDNLALGGESEDDEESGSETSGSDDIGDGGDESDVESLVDGRSDSDLDSGDEELDPEQRGQATGEIEDIVQRLCQMIQKGVLGLDEPIVMDAIAMLQWIAQALANEADEHHKQEHQEKLLQQSSLGAVAPTASPGGSNNNTNQNDVAPQAPSGLLLLIQPLQLSEVDDEMANPAKQGSSPAPSRPLRHSTSSSVRSLAHHRGAHLTAGQRALDLTFCRAMRIRIMSTLGWVHHQRHEYKYGAQAYAVCSEIAPKTGRIQVDTLQRKAVELMRHCQEMDLQQQKDAGGASTVCSSGASINSVHSSSATLHQVFDISTPSTVSTTETGSVCPLSAEVDQNAPVLQQQQQQPILASEAQVLEAAIRIAGLAMESKLKPTVYEGGPVLAAEREARRVCVCEEEPSSPSPPPSAASTSTATATMKVYSKDDNRSPSSPCPRPVETRESLRGRSRSRTRMSADGATKGGAHHLLRIQTEPSLLAKGSSLPKAIATGPQSSSSSSLPFSRRPSLGNHAHSMPQQQPNQHQRHRHCPHSHHHPKAQQQASRPKASGLVFGQPPKNPTQVTLSTCGHCGKKGMQMPLCVCKATRYCNRDCRLADMEVHRSTGCHAALIGGI